MTGLRRRLRLAVPLAIALASTDCATKYLAEEHLGRVPDGREVLGEVVQFTLVYNTGAAMGLPLGDNPRPLLLTAAALIIVFLVVMVWRTSPGDRLQRIALGLILGGALGNGFSRLLSPNGVVDFINVGLGGLRFYVFNVADIGVCSGAILLAALTWRADRAAAGTPAVTST